MRVLGVLAVTLLIVLASVGVAVSAEKLMELKGTISKIDIQARTCTIKDEKSKETTVLVEDVKVLAGLRVGDKVAVKIATKDGKNIAKEVMKEPAQRAPAPAYGK